MISDVNNLFSYQKQEEKKLKGTVDCNLGIMWSFKHLLFDAISNNVFVQNSITFKTLDLTAVNLI